MVYLHLMQGDEKPKNGKIVCLGWGSLVWNPGDLPLHSEWNTDGPVLPLEFARKSKDGRMTLVVCDEGTPCTTLWARLAVNDLTEGIEALQKREGTSAKHVGYWSTSGSSNHPFNETVDIWAKEKNIMGVVWTALPPKSPATNKNYDFPTLEEVLTHISDLDPSSTKLASEYIYNTPQQIKTVYGTVLKRNLSKYF